MTVWKDDLFGVGNNMNGLSDQAPDITLLSPLQCLPRSYRRFHKGMTTYKGLHEASSYKSLTLRLLHDQRSGVPTTQPQLNKSVVDPLASLHQQGNEQPQEQPDPQSPNKDGLVDFMTTLAAGNFPC